ncbi:hypothetical protein P886_2193 [Alteromonadaceae bacterium 2753L.S.0a.02]|nr:hypothetical protein P886_2193 [Alteromonadaceae bacterium 2753L.S.0a.02]
MKYLLLMFLCIPSPAYSKGQETYAANRVGCFLDGVCFIDINPSTTKTSCTNKNQIRFTLSEAAGSEVYSTALAAYASQAKLIIYVNDDCTNGFPSLDWLAISES